MTVKTASTTAVSIDNSQRVNTAAQSTSVYTLTNYAPTDAPTWTPAIMVNGIIVQSPSANRNHTTPTAADIVASIPNCVVGSGFRTVVWNSAGGNNMNIVEGTGVTIFGHTSSQNNDALEYFCVVTNASGGTEAVSCYAMGRPGHGAP